MSEPNQLRVSICAPVAPEWSDGRGRFDPAWATETVRGLARGIEADQAFDRMPILADALEEAGCDDAVLLRHCRTCPTHSPHCWVLWLIREAAEWTPSPTDPRPQDPPMFSTPVKARPSPPNPWAIGTFMLCILIVAATAVIRGCLAGR